MINKNKSQSVKPSIVLIDGREFQQKRRTGIGRVLNGLTEALSESDIIIKIFLVVFNNNSVPLELVKKKKVLLIESTTFFLMSEKHLSALTEQNISLFISPYPKLPLFGCHCPSVHIIHDVLDLTHSAYKWRLKACFDGYRLRKALKRADLTWYDSSWSLEETKKYSGFVGRNPRVRHPGISERFNIGEIKDRNKVLKYYGLEEGYILVIGNGLPHKNLGVLLKIADQLTRKIVFVGVTEEKQFYWKAMFPRTDVTWIEYVIDEDLPEIIRRSFCLAQPSTAEGYGYPPLEAMACGIPVIVSSIPVLLETTGGNTLNANPHDSKEWLNQFKKLEDKTTYQVQISKGLEWIEPLRGINGWENHVRDIEELLKGD